MAVSRAFTDALAKRLGVDPNATFELFSRWQPFEGGSADNPLNTTEDMPGATRWNSVGVKRYKSIEDGVEATARTLSNGLYPNIMTALKTGKIDASIVPDVRMWTTGSRTGESNFAKTLLGGSAGAESWAGGNDMTTSSTSAGSGLDFNSILSSYPPPNPSQFPDPLEYQAAVSQWAQTIANLASASKSLTGPTTDPAQQAFDNSSTTYGNEIAKGKLELDTAATRIDRMLKGMGESRQRADTIAAGQEEIRKYGTAPGKSSFSGQDLGAAFSGVTGAMGLKPTDNLLNYSGTMRVDPAADMAAGDAALGVGGALPDVPRPAALDLGVPTWAVEQLGDAAKGITSPEIQAKLAERPAVTPVQRTAIPLPATLTPGNADYDAQGRLVPLPPNNFIDLMGPQQWPQPSNSTPWWALGVQPNAGEGHSLSDSLTLAPIRSAVASGVGRLFGR